jgi:ribonuclease HII
MVRPALEADWWQMGLRVAGIDEAGRGAIAGPVVAAAVILPPPRGQAQYEHGQWEGRGWEYPVYPFRDSKTLSARARENLEPQIMASALAWGVGRAEAAEIDQLGILKATHLSAMRALEQLDRSHQMRPQAILTDYLHLSQVTRYMSQDLELAQWDLRPLFRCPPKADRDSPTVAAASILAKVARDRQMQELDSQYPGYGFAQHKGYGTPSHLRALRHLGPCVQHRRSFAPVAQRGLF